MAWRGRAAWASAVFGVLGSVVWTLDAVGRIDTARAIASRTDTHWLVLGLIAVLAWPHLTVVLFVACLCSAILSLYVHWKAVKQHQTPGSGNVMPVRAYLEQKYYVEIFGEEPIGAANRNWMRLALISFGNHTNSAVDNIYTHISFESADGNHRIEQAYWVGKPWTTTVSFDAGQERSLAIALQTAADNGPTFVPQIEGEGFGAHITLKSLLPGNYRVTVHLIGPALNTQTTHRLVVRANQSIEIAL